LIARKSVTSEVAMELADWSVLAHIKPWTLRYSWPNLLALKSVLCEKYIVLDELKGQGNEIYNPWSVRDDQEE